MIESLSTMALWVGMGLGASLLAARWGVAVPLLELVVGIAGQAFFVGIGANGVPGADHGWVQLLAGAGAILLTFLAGAELDPATLKASWKEAVLIGAAAFALPVTACSAVAYWVLGWSTEASVLAGIALSETSVAIVYAYLLQSGRTGSLYSRTLLCACFVTDFGTVLALGLFFAPLDARTGILLAATVLSVWALPPLSRRLSARHGGHSAEPEARLLLASLTGLGALALWAGSQAVLPAYILGAALARTVGRDQGLVRRLRTLTFGLLTPFYFIRAGSLVSLPAVVGAPLAVMVLLAAKLLAKAGAVYPVASWHWRHRHLARQTTLLMSTGLTFGSICALFGVSAGVIDGDQYSILLAAIISSAALPTVIATAAYTRRAECGTVANG